MNILAFNDWLGITHDAAAAVVCDGVLVAAAEEERFSRKKHDGTIAFSAIDFCLQAAGLRFADIDLIAFPMHPFRSGSDSGLAWLDSNFLRRLHREGLVRRRSLLHKRILDSLLAAGLKFNLGLNNTIQSGFGTVRQRFGALPPIRFFDHHSCHAAAAYFMSPVERAAVATIDGRGAWFSSVTWKAEGNTLTRLRAEPFNNSLGFFYSDATEYLGLGDFGEGKTMGLAPYGDADVIGPAIDKLLELPPTEWYRYVAAPTPAVLGFPPRTTEPILEGIFPHFAAACQRQLQKAIRRVVNSAVAEAGSPHLCLGGGVALNCSSNGALLASGEFESLTLFPASGDSGLSVGAALLCAAHVGELRRDALKHAYLGPEFNSSRIESALRAEPRVCFQRLSERPTEVARMLANGKIIGWFQGKMEIGPRALGNRSILADPRSVAMRDRVNHLKRREPWRPLAPSVLAERSAEYFDLRGPSPLMLLAAQVKSEKRDQVAAIVHIDGSARPQTVRQEDNPEFYDLIAAFDRQTGIPMLLNTSFNAAGEPIVCTPEDAIRTFLSTRLDALVLGDYVAQVATGSSGD